MNRVLQGLLTKFVLNKGRKPNTLEMILLKREAAETGINERKVISFFDRQPVDPNEPIIGGQNLKKEFISETDDEIIARLNKGNKESISNMKYENAVKAEEAKAAADEDYIMKVLDPEDFSKGGRAGYYGGGAAMVGEDLSEIGHGSDSLMARNMQLAPNSMATTSTGLNYLLGQDNDTARVPYKDAGPVVLPKEKPTNDFKSLLKIYNTYKDSMPGVSEDTQKYLAQDFINKLNEKGLSQTQFQTLRMQNHYEENKADGGRIGFKGGGSDASTTSFSKSYDSYSGTNTAANANKTVDARQAAGQRDADRTNDIIAANQRAARYEITPPKQNIIDKIKDNPYLNNPFTKGALRVGAYTYNPALLGTDLRTLMQLKSGYDKATKFTKKDMTLGIVSEQQQKEIDKQAKIANAMNDTGKLTDIEKNTIFESVKPFDDKGSSGIFGIGATEASPMTQSEFDTYINEKGYAKGGPARQNFKMGKRAFLKFLGSGVAGIAGLKTGLLGFGKKEVAKSVIAPAAQAANEAAIPPYFFKLVNKIKSLGDDVTEKAGTLDRQKVTKYKEYELTEDVSTGQIEIQRMKVTDPESASYYGQALTEESYMSYKPGETIIGKGNKPIKTQPEYQEGTAHIRSDGMNAGEIVDDMPGVSDDLIEEAMEETIKIGKADGGRIGYKVGKKVIKEGVPSLIKKVNKLLGKDTVTTADKLPIPQKTLDRDLFTETNKRLNKKREMTTDEYNDFVEEVGGADQLEAYNFDGTVGDAKRILKEQEDRMKYMYDQYKMGKLDPVAGDKSPARKRFLEKKMEESLMSGDSKLMTREEIDELYNFDLGTEMEAAKKASKIDDDIDISQGMIDLDEMNFTKNAQAAKNKIDNSDVNQKIKEGVASIMSDTSPAALQKSIEIDNLMLKYPGMDKNLAEQIATSEPIKKADIIAMVEQTFKMSEKGMSGDDIIQTFKNTTRTKQATGGLASMLGE
jgi:hypothetical protein